MKKQIAATVLTASIALALTGCGTYNGNGMSSYNTRSDKNHILDGNVRGTQNGNGTYNGAATGNGGLYGNGALNGNGGLDGTMNHNYNNNYGANSMNESRMQAQSTQSQEARTIENKVKKVNGVSKATVFVHGKDVVVGIDATSSAKKAEVEKHVKKVVEGLNKGYKVHVSSDKSMHNRISTLKSQMYSNNGTNGMYGTNGTFGMNGANRSGTFGYGTNGTNGTNGMDGHPIRDFGEDIGALIEDIGNAITAPVRSMK